MTIYVACHDSRPTGGTELLNQYVHALRAISKDALILYCHESFVCPIENAFRFYGNPYTLEFADDKSKVLVVSEGCLNLLKMVCSAQTAVWWLSVDNHYGANYRKSLGFKKALLNIVRHPRGYIKWRANRRRCQKCYNFVQSEYARRYVIDEVGVDSSKVFMLTDYIDPSYSAGFDAQGDRTDTVLYNPVKGKEYTDLLIQANPDLTWKPLAGLSLEEMRTALRTSKVYIDFGPHPGKDRIPREAAASGCCVITGRRGSAANSIDVPIPDEYKFDGLSDIDAVSSKIRDCLTNYQERQADFESYRAWIRDEKRRFEEEVKRSAELLVG